MPYTGKDLVLAVVAETLLENLLPEQCVELVERLRIEQCLTGAPVDVHEAVLRMHLGEPCAGSEPNNIPPPTSK